MRIFFINYKKEGKTLQKNIIKEIYGVVCLIHISTVYTFDWPFWCLKNINIYFLDFAENKYSRYIFFNRFGQKIFGIFDEYMYDFKMYASVESRLQHFDDQSQVQRLPF